MRDPLPIQPIRQLRREPLALPGSKSITNRALVLAALTRKRVTLEGALFSRDTRLMIEAMRELGFTVEPEESTQRITIEGHGGKIPKAEATLHVGNAGTAARFLTAFVCLRKGGKYCFECDEAMKSRPIGGLLEALRIQGAKFTFQEAEDCFPFTVETHGLSGGDMNVNAEASSQILTALLMVAPCARKETTLYPGKVRPSYIHMTMQMMEQFGVDADAADVERQFVIKPQHYETQSPIYQVEPDASAASYFLALPLVAGGGYTLQGLGFTSLQGDVAFAGVLEKLGLSVYRSGNGWDIQGGPLKLDSLTENFTHFSDTFLTLAALVPALNIPVEINGIAHTRKQETDRLLGMARELEKLGMKIEPSIEALEADIELGDLTITPNRDELIRRAKAARESGELLTIETYEDHRFAMSFGILGCYDLLGDGQPWLQIADPACCGKTFPKFFEVLEQIACR